MAKKSSRRDFLRGQLPLSSQEGSGDELGARPSSRREAGPQSYLLHVSRPAMASRFELIFNAGQYENDAAAAVEALNRVEALEGQLSYFRPESEISRINALAADEPVHVEPALFELLSLCREIHDQTGGAYDIASARLWEVWGFARRAGRVPREDELAEAIRESGSRLVELDCQEQTVRFRRAGVRLNLGSIGKGYALDCAGQMLTAAGIGDYLFHGGQSSITARGSRQSEHEPAERSGGGWSVGIRHPLRPERRIAELRLRDSALGTSGSATQHFWHQGRRYSHILDPRTGRPAEGMLSATVIAASAAVADAVSTALFVMGVDEALQFCQSRPDIAAVLIGPSRAPAAYEMRTIGLQDDQLTVLAD